MRDPGAILKTPFPSLGGIRRWEWEQMFLMASHEAMIFYTPVWWWQIYTWQWQKNLTVAKNIPDGGKNMANVNWI